MGMYDCIKVKYLLDNPVHNGLLFQTKSLARMLDYYEIREDGTLWHEVVTRKWEDNPNSPIGGYLKDQSRKWLPVGDFEGVLSFHDSLAKVTEGGEHGWVEYNAVFVDSRLVKMVLVKEELPT